MGIKRYVVSDDGHVNYPDGDWVKFSDYKQEIRALKAKIAALTPRACACHGRCEHAKNRVTRDS